MSLTAPEQTAPAVQDQQPAAPAVSAPPAAPVAPPSGPWAADLAAAFPDDTTRTQVDMFLRTKTQPYITQLEQTIASNRDAESLWNDLRDNTVDTYVQITNELYGEAAAGKVLETLQSTLNADEVGTLDQQAQAAVSELDPRLAQVIEYVENQQNEQQYNTLMKQTVDANPDVNEQLLHTFVAAAGGHFPEAVAQYRAFMAQVQPAAAATPAPVAPPVMGSGDGGSPPNTPQIPQKQTLWEAVDEFMRDQHAEAPPVM